MGEKIMLKNILKKNEIIYQFLLKIKFSVDLFSEKIKNYYYKKNLKKIVEDYSEYRRNNKPKGVVYTCIVGEYDNLKSHKYIDFDWDYICFTNNKKIKTDGIWQIKELQYKDLDNIRNARWHKINTHKILNNYILSIWIDGNVRILSKKFFEELDKKRESLFLSTIHPKRRCIYEEIQACLELKKDESNIILAQEKKLKELGCPQKLGLFESNIVFRHHNEVNIKKLDEEWWEWIKNYSRRDQLSLTFVCWKNNIPIEFISKQHFRQKNELIEIVRHY